MWNTKDSLVGQRVTIYTAYDDEETVTVLAVSDKSDMIKVRAEDGTVMIGNQWEPA